MTLDDRIADQRARIEKLQQELLAGQRPDLRRPRELERERATQLRATLETLERAKTASIARFDREIAAVAAEIAALETPSDLDTALRRLNYGESRQQPGPQSDDNGL